jgi:hypothetical protein
MTQLPHHLLHHRLHQTTSLKPRSQSLRNVTTQTKTPTLMYLVNGKSFQFITGNQVGLQQSRWRHGLQIFMNISNHLQQLNEKVKKSDMCLFVKSADLSLQPCIWSLTFPLRNPSVVVTRVRHDESTSNLVCHADKCTPSATTATASIATFAHGSTYSYPRFQMKLVLWVVWCHWLFSLVKDEELINIFMDLNNKVEVPSQKTVSHDVKDIFNISHTKVTELLQVG